MERVPVARRVPIALPFRVYQLHFSAVNIFVPDVDLKIACDAAVFEQNVGEKVGVHFFNFPLNASGKLFVPSATTELYRHLVRPLRVSHGFSRYRFAAKNSHYT